MAFPKQYEIEIPLLKTIDELGGSGKTTDIYPRVAKYFPQLTEEDLLAKLPSSPSTYKWQNLVQWCRQGLVDKGEIDGSTRGIWKITVKGKEHLKGKITSVSNKTPELIPVAPQIINLKDLIYQNETEVKNRIIAELKGLKAKEFEQFCKSFLQLLGYQQLEVTSGGPDGGIDGHGQFRQGVVTIRSAFQAKKWTQNPVGRPEIDKFRGAIQGDFDHGVFLTTAKFTKDAEAASVKKGAISILLLDGDAIAETMVKFGIGVTRRPVQLLDIDPEFFKFEVSGELI
jgi:restriction system protein